ncbi:MAG: hypothetical protein IJW05_04240 [Lentisphaeria bacterium]|nr:hypothetical protein [Lentisphaeria bacterium]
MTIEDVKKIAIEEYKIKNEDLEIIKVDENTICFYSKDKSQNGSFMALLKEELVFSNP